jgi:hypothetical protein
MVLNYVKKSKTILHEHTVQSRGILIRIRTFLKLQMHKPSSVTTYVRE